MPSCIIFFKHLEVEFKIIVIMIVETILIVHSLFPQAAKCCYCCFDLHICKGRLVELKNGNHSTNL
jgi:hypothetical protein